MIVGVGLDLCSVPRIRALLDKWGERFAEKIFTEGERAYCAARAFPAQHFAARFAAREATLKALGVPRGLSWYEMEVVAGRGGPPALRLTGEAAAAASRLRVARAHLSLTHLEEVAGAVVVLESA